MTREDVYKKLNEIFCDIFDDESIVLSDDTTADDIEDWDSLEQINIINQCEAEFGIKFNMKEVTSLKNVGEMVNIILEKLQQEIIDERAY